MATFVLVHGTSCGGWIWQRLAPLLRAAGNVVYTPTLSGLGDRSHLFHCGINLTTHITDIANLLSFEDLSDVVLVGNSYGGMVITGVSARVPERLKRVVYLDAYVPDAGQCEFDLLPPETRIARKANAAAHDGGLTPPPLAMFGVTEPQLAWAQSRMTLHPIATYEEPVPAGDARSAALPRVFIHCIANPRTTPDLFATSAQKARAHGWPVYDLAAGHLPQLTAPREIADMLLEIAQSDSHLREPMPARMTSGK